ncbi:MAG: hypothetical protein KAS32_13345 [Candidatus Peribacteraceae bacterium]|nr:hypothetical protein [Candidatus Peribacteraceae bacterium]
MKMIDTDGKDIIAGNPSDKPVINDERLLYGAGDTIKEKKKKKEADKVKRIDE